MTPATSISSRPGSPPPSDRATPRAVRVGLVGARGHAGGELLRLIDGHPSLSLAFASSRELAGRPLRDAAPAWRGDECFVNSDPEEVAALEAEVIVLALPDGASHEYVRAIEARNPGAVVVDLSSDHRFDDNWAYGLPELDDGRLPGARRIANPGCYATAMLLALVPIAGLIDGVPHVFGVSGYSGAGTTPSPRNDPEVLRDGVLPYRLADHVHEREASHRLGRPIRFAPHVAPFFRGISVTILATLAEPMDVAVIVQRYRESYREHPLVRVIGEEVPLVNRAANRVHATVGGIATSAADPRRVAVVATLDNLLKGAASQAVQNINLACGLPALEGLEP